MRDEIECVIGPRQWGDTRESWLSRLPKAVKQLLGTKTETVSMRAVKALWYGEITDPEHHAARDLRRAAELAKAQRQARELADRYSKIAGELSAYDPNLLREDIARLERVARMLGTGDRAG